MHDRHSPLNPPPIGTDITKSPSLHKARHMQVNILHDEGEVDLGVADLDINLELAFTLGLRLLE